MSLFDPTSPRGRTYPETGGSVAADLLEAESGSPLAYRSDDRLTEIVAALSAAVYEAEAGADGRWLFASDGIAELLGYTPAEWTSEPGSWRRAVHPEDLPIAVSRDTNIRMAGRLSVTEYRMLNREGNVVWVRDEARLARLGDRMVWRGTLTDVTRERRGRQILAGAIDRYRKMATGRTRLPAPEGGEPAPDLPDAFRLHCRACDATWAADELEVCGGCGSERVDATSVNATLRELDLAGRKVKELLGGIEEHLEHLAAGRRLPPRFAKADRRV